MFFQCTCIYDVHYPVIIIAHSEYAGDVTLTRIFRRLMEGLSRNYAPSGIPPFSNVHPQQHIQLPDVQKACMHRNKKASDLKIQACMHRNKIASDLKIQDLINEISGELYQCNPVNSRSFLYDYLRGSDLYIILLSFDHCIYFSSVMASSMFLLWIGWMPLLHVSVPPLRLTPLFTNACPDYFPAQRRIVYGASPSRPILDCRRPSITAPTSRLTYALKVARSLVPASCAQYMI